MVHEQYASSLSLPFAIVRKGFDRDEVRDYFEKFDAELRVTGADRDAAAAQARDLARQLEESRNQIDDLRRDVDRLSVSPTTAEGMGDRISRMLRLASDEASEVRAAAEAEAAETVSVARQDAQRLRGEYETLIAEGEDKQAAQAAEHEQTMTMARDEASRIVAAAKSERERLAAEAQAHRQSVQEDFDLAMSEKRAKTIATLEEMEANARATAERLKSTSEATAASLKASSEASAAALKASSEGEASRLEARSKAEAERRVADATHEAERRLQAATDQSERKIANAQAVAEELRTLRDRILAQLIGVRGQLDSVPAMLAPVGREPELLDISAQEAAEEGKIRVSGEPGAEARTQLAESAGPQTQVIPAVELNGANQ
jgi:cell division septum initiation protein DivIVA